MTSRQPCEACSKPVCLYATRKTSDPPMCRKCRAKRRILMCDYCSMPFRSKCGKLTQRYCCVRHGALGRWLSSRIETSST